ncbi:Uncharacterised protein [Sphingobacterium multivorum]|nr:Uncharacterised protein [Sphingobacterium multivorum]
MNYLLRPTLFCQERLPLFLALFIGLLVNDITPLFYKTISLLPLISNFISLTSSSRSNTSRKELLC